MDKTNFDISVIGLGLMGMSLVKALKGKGYKIWGLDTNKEASLYALNNGYIIKNDYDIETSFKSSKIVILALMPRVAVSIIEEYKYALNENTILSDFCGVKKDIHNISKDLNYIGIHTMAGREVGGYENSKENLFINCNTIITPNELVSDTSIEAIKNILTSIGSRNIITTNYEEHDRQIAFTSQLMHIVAAGIVSQDEFLLSLGFEGNSLMDHTRVGTIDYNMWSELFCLNSESLHRTLSNYINILEKYKRALKNKDQNELKNILEFANNNKQKWIKKKK